jgi:hypothetical protein
MAGNASRVRELRGLASVWNDLGLRVLEMGGWEDRGRSSVIDFDVLGCHHTAASVDVDALLRDGRTGIPGPLCNVALHGRAPAGWKGEVVLVASGRANHFGVASISSSRGLGVEATGPPFPNYDAYVLLAAGYCIYYKRDPDQVVVPAGGTVHTAVRRVTAHKYVAQPEGRKINPSFDMGAFLRRVDAARAGQVEEWWQMSIPATELVKVQGAAADALQSSEGQAAIARAVRAVLQEATPTGQTSWAASWELAYGRIRELTADVNALVAQAGVEEARDAANLAAVLGAFAALDFQGGGAGWTPEQIDQAAQGIADRLNMNPDAVLDLLHRRLAPDPSVSTNPEAAP